ncbi:MAG: hypothetical protein ABIZ70_14395 [Gemmatimonadales bacterium]
MRILRWPAAVLPFLLVAGCGESPTLAGSTMASGHGALLVYRTAAQPGLPYHSEWTAIDPESGASLGRVNWMPSAGVLSEFTFSRDGNWIAWDEPIDAPLQPWDGCDFTDVCGPQQLSRNLYVAHVGESSRINVTPQYSYDRMPSFSPDGDRLVLIRGSYDSQEQMISIRRDGGDVRALLPKSLRRRDRPDWSPRSQQILYSRPDIGALYAVDADGKNPRALTDTFVQVGPATWSPDGALIAVAIRNRPIRRGNYYEFTAERFLGLLRPDGSVMAKIPIQREPYLRAVWSPDGSRVVTCDDAGIRITAVATGESRQITPAGYYDCPVLWRP